MASNKITLKVCRSCITQNPQEDSAFQDEETLRKTYEKRLKKGFFGANKIELHIVDCLTNCENPNSAQIDRVDEEMLLGFIRREEEVEELIRLAKELEDPRKPLAPSEKLKKNLVYVRSHTQWRIGEDAFHADRIRLSPSSEK